MKEPHYFFNIWDDYDESDGATHGYVESERKLLREVERAICVIVRDAILALPPGPPDEQAFQMTIDDTDIEFEHLTHAARERIVTALETIPLSYDGLPIVVASES